MARMVETPDGDLEWAYVCHRCEDTGYVPGKPLQKFGRAYETVKACQFCETGRLILAGAWLDKLEPRKGKPSPRARAELDAFLKENPDLRERLREDIERLKEIRRTRKVEYDAPTA